MPDDRSEEDRELLLQRRLAGLREIARAEAEAFEVEKRAIVERFDELLEQALARRRRRGMEPQ